MRNYKKNPIKHTNLIVEKYLNRYVLKKITKMVVIINTILDSDRT